MASLDDVTYRYEKPLNDQLEAAYTAKQPSLDFDRDTNSGGFGFGQVGSISYTCSGLSGPSPKQINTQTHVSRDVRRREEIVRVGGTSGSAGALPWTVAVHASFVDTGQQGEIRRIAASQLNAEYNTRESDELKKSIGHASHLSNGSFRLCVLFCCEGAAGLLRGWGVQWFASAYTLTTSSRHPT